MAFDESIGGYLFLDCTLRVPDIIGCMLGCLFLLGTLTCWLWRLFILIEDSDCGDFYFYFYFFLVLHCYYLFGDIDMLIILIVHFTLLSIVTLILPCLFWLPHMYRLTIVYHLIWHDCFSWLYIILIIICQIFSSISLCVDLDDIYLFCMTICCMTSSYPDVIAWVACLCGTHTYPLISQSLVSVDIVFLALVFDMRLVALFALRPS